MSNINFEHVGRSVRPSVRRSVGPSHVCPSHICKIETGAWRKKCYRDDPPLKLPKKYKKIIKNEKKK